MKSKYYRVTWEIQLDAESPEAAALEALDCIINGSARVFTATDGPGNAKEVDLMEYGNGGAKHYPGNRELLDALKKVTDMYETAMNGKYDDPDEAEVIDKARAVIAKAGDLKDTEKEAGPLICSGEEGICPKCGGDLELDEEESESEEGRANWTCPDCGATGVQVREVVFKCHESIETPEDAEARAKAALYPEPRTEYNSDGTLEFKAIGAGSGKWGPQISKEEAERLLRERPEDVQIYCKEASDTPGLWAGIEAGDLEDGKLPEDWQTFEIMFSPDPNEFRR